MAEANTPGEITVKRIVREYAFTLLILLAVLGTLYYGWPALIAYFFPLGGVIPATIATIESKQTRSTRHPAPYQGEEGSRMVQAVDYPPHLAGAFRWLRSASTPAGIIEHSNAPGQT
jgi:hypothetical protein